MSPRLKAILVFFVLLMVAAVLSFVILQFQPRTQVSLRSFPNSATAESPQVSLDNTTTNALLERHLNQYVEAVGTVNFDHKVGPILTCGDSWLVLESSASLPRRAPGTYLVRGTLRAWDEKAPDPGEVPRQSLSPGRYYRLDNAMLILR